MTFSPSLSSQGGSPYAAFLANLNTLLAASQNTRSAYNAQAVQPTTTSASSASILDYYKASAPSIQQPSSALLDSTFNSPYFGVEPPANNRPAFLPVPTSPFFLPQAQTPPAPAPMAPIVAAGQLASVWGDPHISDPDMNKGDMRAMGQEVRKTGIFNLLNDNKVELNATFSRAGADPNSPTFVTAAGLNLAGNRILVNADGTVKLNDEAFNQGGFKLLPDGTQLRYIDKLFSVKTPNEYTVEFHTQQEWDKNKIMDVVVLTGNKGVLQDGVTPTGMLGVLFDADDKPRANFTEAELTGFTRNALFTPATSPTTSPSPVATTPPVVTAPPVPPVVKAPTSLLGAAAFDAPY
jgi:hypothetical protein